MFADRLSAVLESTSALPLEELQAGLLELRPFRFGSPFSSSSSSSLSSSASSTSSSSSALSELEDGDGGGGGSGGTEVDATGGDSRQRARKPSDDPAAEKGGARKVGRSQEKRAGREVPASAQRGGSPTSSEPAARASAQAEAPPPASGSPVDLCSAGRRHPGGREKSRSNLTTADKNNGWVRSRSSQNSFSMGEGGGRRGRSGAPTTPHTPGCWVPPPTRWGGTSIRSPLFWGGEGSTAAHMGGGKEGDGCVDTGCGRRSRGSPLDFHDGGEPEWEGKEEGADTQEPGFEIKDIEFFRTADGRSLFAESLSGAEIGGGKAERLCHAIEWGEDGDSDDQGRHRRGFLCLLGEEGRCDSERGSPDDGRRLGVAARRRRARIDTRSRDGKRRAEMMFARDKIKRLEEEVNLFLGLRGIVDASAKPFELVVNEVVRDVLTVRPTTGQGSGSKWWENSS